MMRLGTRLKCIENSPEVHRELAEGIGSLPGWCKGVRRKKTKTRRKIIEGSRKAYRELYGPRIKLKHWAKVLDDAMKARYVFAKTSPKVSGRSLGIRREIARGRL
ncbi:hypothetical protein B296_00048254 [Ensete ventricosum]|uniref:Uncharacterized protein n=1 Tax=Ensete ventricosum TaxID=4639 RepID=A0A426Y877_ENSVE|nr:hypothetical protein B296_00048254 [Ensete ventricosum]